MTSHFQLPTKLSDWAGLVGLVIAGTLAFANLRSETGAKVSELSHKVDLILMNVQSIEEENDRLARLATMNLWIEQVRQASDLKSIPAFPPQQ